MGSWRRITRRCGRISNRERHRSGPSPLAKDRSRATPPACQLAIEALVAAPLLFLVTALLALLTAVVAVLVAPLALLLFAALTLSVLISLVAALLTRHGMTPRWVVCGRAGSKRADLQVWGAGPMPRREKRRAPASRSGSVRETGAPPRRAGISTNSRNPESRVRGAGTSWRPG